MHKVTRNKDNKDNLDPHTTMDGEVIDCNELLRRLIDNHSGQIIVHIGLASTRLVSCDTGEVLASFEPYEINIEVVKTIPLSKLIP